MSTIESWTHLQMRWLICTLLIHFQISLDSFANKDSFAYEFWLVCKWSWLICKWVISHLQMSLSCQLFFNNLLQKFAFGPNWVWRKELFLTLINLEGIFLLPMWIPSQRSQVRRFWIKSSLEDRIFSSFFLFGSIL